MSIQNQTPKFPLTTRRTNPALASKLAHMRLKIAPIVHIETGLPPPSYPVNVLTLFLLTEDQLDYFAHYYSQVHPNELTDLYPGCMNWDEEFLSAGEEVLTEWERITIKRRKFAKFIGMRGCETPTWEVEKRIGVIEERIRRCVEQEERLAWSKFGRFG